MKPAACSPVHARADAGSDVGLATALRAPVQQRSRASYERMLAAAETLMIARGSDDFTLQDVSRKGRVSIGSIYNRFEGKDAMLRAVQLRVLDRVDRVMRQRLDGACAAAATLPALVVAMTEAVAETLHENAGAMRPLMQRVAGDALVVAKASAAYTATANAVTAALLAHAGEIRQPDPARAADSAFRILYAAIARHLGFGPTTATPATCAGDWGVLKQDLARMVAAFLGTVPAF